MAGYRDIERAIRYRKEDIEWLRKKYYPGQKITVSQMKEDGEETSVKVRKQYTVVQTFPYHVSCVDRNGFRRSFGYVEVERITI